MGGETTAVDEIQRLRSLHHARKKHMGFPSIGRRSLGLEFHQYAVDEANHTTDSGDKSMGQTRDQCTVPHRISPKSRSELDQWRNFISTYTRSNLFTFAGGRRSMERDFRSILFNQCKNEPSFCKLIDCSIYKCSDAPEIFSAFLSSNFCLQPRGETYTRKSIFDCMLAGSIPVFFWKETFYTQYQFFLGDNPIEFAVFIDRKNVRNGTSVREVLESYSSEEIRRLRENVVSLIPRFIYSFTEMGYKDAFNIAIDEVMKTFKRPDPPSPSGV